ncbi:response regulator transcription factor [Paenibacillus donghaensis]|uniref:DNA-binding response regulator n=1 Tax=Paenibacillus donghaensis TaxID=414771 RepID=A0A2Z2KQF5_9BACL|nr:response regulator transcription factor [Paenibacillus donghaensis]ASA22551.1 DNA-binding response regulator [Paenibacillus donghaensis]
MNNARLLLIDDEEAILKLLEAALNKEGLHNIHTATTAAEGRRLCRQVSPDLIVIDVMLPDGDGLELCRDIRQLTAAPIFFLTARSGDLDKLSGFTLGADDYITKPFMTLEVVARIKAHLRRHFRVMEEIQEEPVYDFGHFQVQSDSGTLIVAGIPVVCPAKEFHLLLFLCRNTNHIFSKNQLYEHVWGEESMGDDHTVMVHIRRLREKIEPEPGSPRYLVTHRGLGYKLIQPVGLINQAGRTHGL